MSSGDRTRHPELTFCPFCGEPDDLETLDASTRGHPQHIIHCGTCGANGPPGATPLAAADFWNERARK